ncbi:MAG: T9SS type A sorting domain-containing protein [Bacteroidetes bacterium]|nr:T9SS type A sorting domain-containing protein [Bacteroidota bacterium]HNR18365.1 T9SS type A sorting domain-containing protein [Bacteroidia bacterium]HNU32315.1 T9SS type A sorting domain-containing protein [Bacteroidia bacterium]
MGNLLRALYITNAVNTDWEEVCKDDNGDFYIGDFGNNLNNRTDLKIVIVPNPSVIIGDSVAAQIINFSYPDQVAFPPHDSLKNFDMEAMFWFNDSLYLFSKNRTVPYNGYTKMYKLPSQPGSYVAQLTDSFFTGVGNLINNSITSATISSTGDKMLLISNTQGWLFSGFAGDNFFNGNVFDFSFGGTQTQKEGAAFINNGEVYFTDERLFSTGGNLYGYDFSTVVGSEHLSQTMNEFKVSPNPTGNTLRISFRFPFTKISALKILNSKGEEVFKLGNIDMNDAFFYEVNSRSFLNGVYFVQLFTSKGYFLKRLTVIH